jgi:hypothetical protein
MTLEQLVKYAAVLQQTSDPLLQCRVVEGPSCFEKQLSYLDRISSSSFVSPNATGTEFSQVTTGLIQNDKTKQMRCELDPPIMTDAFENGRLEVSVAAKSPEIGFAPESDTADSSSNVLGFTTTQDASATTSNNGPDTLFWKQGVNLSKSCIEEGTKVVSDLSKDGTAMAPLVEPLVTDVGASTTTTGVVVDSASTARLANSVAAGNDVANDGAMDNELRWDEESGLPINLVEYEEDESDHVNQSSSLKRDVLDDGKLCFLFMD